MSYGDLNWVLPDASSTSEIIVDMINDSQGQLQLNQAADSCALRRDCGRYWAVHV